MRRSGRRLDTVTTQRRPHIGRGRQRSRHVALVEAKRLVVREQLEVGRVDCNQTVQALHGLCVRGLDPCGRATSQRGLAAVVVVVAIGAVMVASMRGRR